MDEEKEALVDLLNPLFAAFMGRVLERWVDLFGHPRQILEKALKGLKLPTSEDVGAIYQALRDLELEVQSLLRKADLLIEAANAKGSNEKRRARPAGKQPSQRNTPLRKPAKSIPKA